jgi:hypothetical protein
VRLVLAVAGGGAGRGGGGRRARMVTCKIWRVCLCEESPPSLPPCITISFVELHQGHLHHGQRRAHGDGGGRRAAEAHHREGNGGLRVSQWKVRGVR